MHLDQFDWQQTRIEGEKESRNLLESVTSKSRTFVGRIHKDKEVFYASSRLLPGDNAILFVAQRQSRAMHEYHAALSVVRRFVFGATLLLGLFSIAYTTILLARQNERAAAAKKELERQVSLKTRELVKTRNAIIFGLAKLAESRDNDTGEHLDRIHKYVTILANHLSMQYPETMNEEFIHTLGLASSLHDIGKVGIPDAILLKPGRLTPEERSVIELHTIIGGECLDAIHERLGDNKFMEIARQVTYSHHERWDGTGYPHKLGGTEIPLTARIVSVADVYDALTSKRPYKRAMSHLESKAIIVSGSGTQFDPDVVAAFLAHEDAFEAISIEQQKLSDEDTKSDFQRRVEQFEPLAPATDKA